MKKFFSSKSKKETYENADMDTKLIINLRDINHVMHALYEGKGSQKRILIILLENENITQHELTEKLEIKPGSASEVIAKLENQGLITKTPSNEDRRTANITLTEKGQELAIQAKTQRENRHSEMFSSLSNDEKLSLISQLEKINKDWEKFDCIEHKHHHHHMGHHKGHHHHHNDFHNENHNEEEHHHGCDRNCSECPHPCGRKKHNI